MFDILPEDCFLFSQTSQWALGSCSWKILSSELTRERTGMGETCFQLRNGWCVWALWSDFPPRKRDECSCEWGKALCRGRVLSTAQQLRWKAAGLSPAILSERSEGLYDGPSFLCVGVIHLHSCSFSLPSPSPTPFPPPKINHSPRWSAVLWLVLTRIASLNPSTEVGNSYSLKPAVLQRGEAVSLAVLLHRCSVAVSVQHTSWVW